MQLLQGVFSKDARCVISLGRESNQPTIDDCSYRFIKLINPLLHQYTAQCELLPHSSALNNTVPRSHPSSLTHEIPSLQSSGLISREGLISHSLTPRQELHFLNFICHATSYLIGNNRLNQDQCRIFCY